MPTYGGTPVLTIGKFDQARAVVTEWFEEHGDGEFPTPYKPGHEGPMWVLSLEGGHPQDWAIRITEDLRDKWPEGVYAQAVYPWCLGLYPA